MRIAICEDNTAQAKLAEKYIREWSKSKNQHIEIHSYISAESFIFSLEDAGPFDVLLLDIQMAEMTGIELAKEMRKQENDVAIIFITALKEYVFEGYDVDALQYILKPMNKEKLFFALNRAMLKINKEEQCIIIENTKIKQSDIIYIEAQAHYIEVYTKNKVIRTKKSLKDMYCNLNKDIFFFSHRSYIINLSKIEKIQKEDIILEHGYKVPVSRSKYREVNEAFISFFTGEADVYGL